MNAQVNPRPHWLTPDWPAFAARLRTVSSAAIAIGVVAIAVVIAAWINLQAIEASRLVAKSIDVRERSEGFLGNLLDAETGQRGFLLTGDEAYLAPYNESRFNVLPELDVLERMVADNPAQVERIRQARDLARRKLVEMNATIALVRDGKREEALATLRQGDGNRLMQELRDTAGAIQADENRLLRERSRRETRRRIFASIGILVALAGLSFVAWLQLRSRGRRNIFLSSSNLELEQRVAERTQQLENERLRIESLLRDVNHRVGNNLAMVSALLSVQSRQAREPVVKQALAQAQSRIQAIAAGQRRLRLDIEADEIDARPYMEDLLAEIGKQAEGRPITIELAMEPIRLPGRDAVSFVVIINELVTNAIKHAFPHGMAGKITIRLANGPEGADDLILAVEDDGVGMPAEEAAAGLGNSVIKSLLRSMRAAMETGPLTAGATRPGTRIALTFPKRLEAGDEAPE